jgi:hypothetical protein
MRSNNLFDWIVKFILLLLFGPVLLCAALRIIAAFLQQALPLLIVLALLAGVAAGLSRAFAHRERGSRPRARNQAVPEIPSFSGHRRGDDRHDVPGRESISDEETAMSYFTRFFLRTLLAAILWMFYAPIALGVAIAQLIAGRWLLRDAVECPTCRGNVPLLGLWECSACRFRYYGFYFSRHLLRKRTHIHRLH